MNVYNYDKKQNILKTELERLQHLKNNNTQRLLDDTITQNNEYLDDIHKNYNNEYNQKNKLREERDNKINALIHYIDNALKMDNIDETTRLNGKYELHNLKKMLK